MVWEHCDHFWQKIFNIKIEKNKNKQGSKSMNNHGMKNKPYTREWMLFNSTLFYLTKMPSNFCHSALNHQQSKKFVHKLRWQVVAFFYHLPPSVDIFYAPYNGCKKPNLLAKYLPLLVNVVFERPHLLIVLLKNSDCNCDCFA